MIWKFYFLKSYPQISIKMIVFVFSMRDNYFSSRTKKIRAHIFKKFFREGRVHTF